MTRVVDANAVDANVVDANVVDANVVDANAVVPDAEVPITRQAPVVNKPLFIRYPGSRQGWLLFDETNVTAQHQKIGLELFIESGKDSMEVSIQHAMGGQFIATYKKSAPIDETIVYSYIPLVATGIVQMMYAEPAYVGYINRVTT